MLAQHKVLCTLVCRILLQGFSIYLKMLAMPCLIFFSSQTLRGDSNGEQNHVICQNLVKLKHQGYLEGL